MELGLGYLSLDRAASTLSTGERQRMQLARAVRNRTTGVLYVLDEPSIGLHPSRDCGAHRRDARPCGRRQFRAAGRSRHADSFRRRLAHRNGARSRRTRRSRWSPKGALPTSRPILIRASGAFSGTGGFSACARSVRPTLSSRKAPSIWPQRPFIPCIRWRWTFRRGRLTVVTGVSGSGKTTLILESLAPALNAFIRGSRMPDHVRELRAEGIRQVGVAASTPAP